MIFGKNTTEAINKLACRYPLTGRNIVVSTGINLLASVTLCPCSAPDSLRGRTLIPPPDPLYSAG